MDPITAVLNLSSKVNQSQRLIAAYERLAGGIPAEPEIHIDERIRTGRLPETDRKGYILLPLIPGYRTLCIRFCVMGHAFRKRGYEPLVLRDDRDLPIRPELSMDDEGAIRAIEGCRYRAKRYPKLFDIESVCIGDILDGRSYDPNVAGLDDAELQSFTYDGVNLSKPARASTRRYLKKYKLDTTDPRTWQVFTDFVRGGMMIAEAVQELLNQYDVEVALVNEAYYIQGQVPLDICRTEGIGVYSQKKGYHTGNIMFGTPANRDYMGQYGDAELTAKAVNTELSSGQRERIKVIMERRQEGKVTPYKYTTDTDSSVSTERGTLVGVFSNLLWDGALEPEQSIYRDVREWFDDTIQTATEKEDTQFVIKAHPGEAKRNTNEGIADWIEEDYRPLPENVDFLSPDTDVNTYALIDDLDAGIVYASTVGLEMALNGVPVLVGGFPPYHGFGITHDPSSKSKYTDHIRNIERLEHPSERERRAWRFAYFLFICEQLDFPPLANSDGEIQLTHEDIVGEDSIYTSIVDQILAREEVLSPGCLDLK